MVVVVENSSRGLKPCVREKPWCGGCCSGVECFLVFETNLVSASLLYKLTQLQCCLMKVTPR